MTRHLDHASWRVPAGELAVMACTLVPECSWSRLQHMSQYICILIYRCAPSREPHKKTLGKEFVKAPLGQRAAPALGKSKQFSLASDDVVGRMIKRPALAQAGSNHTNKRKGRPNGNAPTKKRTNM